MASPQNLNLDVAQQALLDDVVDRIVGSMRHELGRQANEGVGAVCIDALDDGDTDILPSPIDVMTRGDWDDALTIEDRNDRWERVWNNSEWSVEVTVAETLQRRPEVDEEVLSILGERVQGNPSLWLFEEVSRRLSREPPVGALPLFVCYVGDSGPSENLPYHLRRVALASTIEGLDRLGLLYPPR